MNVNPPGNFGEFVGLLTDLIGLLVITVFALTFFVFIWGLVKNIIIDGGDETSLTKGKHIMLWGIIVLVIMTAIWGILNLLQVTFFG